VARQSLSTLVAWLAAGAAFALSASCESRAATAIGVTAVVPLRITAVTVGTPISTLIVEVEAADLPSTLVFNLTVQNGVASGTIKVPPGSARTIHVSAVDDQGTLTHDGSVTIDVRPGQNPPVQVILRPRSGQIPITVTFGNYTVLVAPTEATIDPSVTAQLQLTPTVIDVDGQHIASPQVGWATTQPAVAVVDQHGLVTGIANGTATIVATFEGVAGLSVVTVTKGNAGSPEVCDGVDNDLDGQIDEGLRYCLNGVAAPHTNGADCLPGFQDVDGVVENGCEASIPTEVTLVPSAVTVAAGTTGTLFAKISTIAPAGGITVTLTSGSALITVPSEVTILENTTNVTFSVTAGSVLGVASVTATLGGSSSTSTITIVP
jgi:Big-like domain-containing protein